MKPGSYIQMDWHKTHEGREIMTSIMHRNMHRRKVFGLLEHPSFPPQQALQEFHYKVFVSGKSGVGKTSTVAKLAGNEVPTAYCETPGIQTSVVYWPARIYQQKKTVMFRLQFWDAGENALKKFDHVLPACREQADAVLFLFSFTDKSSFDDLPPQVARILQPSDNMGKLVIGTKYDLLSKAEVSQRDLLEFESQWNLPVLKIKNLVDYHQTEMKTEVNEVAPVLNRLCEHLWHRDQILSGNVRDPKSTTGEFEMSQTLV